MKRKEHEKQSRKYSDDEIAEVLKSYGGHWVLVGDKDDEQLINVIDNDVFKKFEAIQYMDDDEVWGYTMRKYLLNTNLKCFPTHEALDVYIEELTKEKYGL